MTDDSSVFTVKAGTEAADVKQQTGYHKFWKLSVGERRHFSLYRCILKCNKVRWVRLPTKAHLGRGVDPDGCIKQDVVT